MQWKRGNWRQRLIRNSPEWILIGSLVSAALLTAYLLR